jgi:hypothetical protein
MADIEYYETRLARASQNVKAISRDLDQARDTGNREVEADCETELRVAKAIETITRVGLARFKENKGTLSQLMPSVYKSKINLK